MGLSLILFCTPYSIYFWGNCCIGRGSNSYKCLKMSKPTRIISIFWYFFAFILIRMTSKTIGAKSFEKPIMKISIKYDSLLLRISYFEFHPSICSMIPISNKAINITLRELWIISPYVRGFQNRTPLKNILCIVILSDFSYSMPTSFTYVFTFCPAGSMLIIVLVLLMMKKLLDSVRTCRYTQHTTAKKG